MRYNIFHEIHQGLRCLLHETALELQRSDFAQTEEALRANESLSRAINLFQYHSDTEARSIFSLIKFYEPSVADTFEQERPKDELLTRLLDGSMRLFVSAETIAEKLEAGRMIQSAYSQFLVFKLERMMREEEVLNPLFWYYYSDQELQEVAKKIIREMPPAYIQSFHQCILRGLNSYEMNSYNLNRSFKIRNMKHFVWALLAIIFREKWVGRMAEQNIHGIL